MKKFYILILCAMANADVGTKASGPMPIQTTVEVDKVLVRVGSDIPDAEKNYVLGQRRYKACMQLHELGVHNPVNIAVCASGGGDRAMLATTGSLLGAQNIKAAKSDANLLGGITYMAAVSGSTWLQALWQTTGKSLQEIKAGLKRNLSRDTILACPVTSLDDIEKKEVAAFIKNMVSKTTFGQDVGPVDIWGALLANHIFKDMLPQNMSRINARLTNTQMPNVIKTELPFPIYTAVEGHGNMRWFEVTPIESGFTDIGWVPTWAINRKFKRGCSKKCKLSSILRGTDYPPEPTLSYFLAIFGSAFTINLREFIDKVSLEEAFDHDDELNEESSVFKEAFSKAADFVLDGLKSTPLGDMHVPAADILNYSYKMPHSAIQYQKTFELRDAAMSFNLPLPPLLRKEREIDVILILDQSGDILELPGLEMFKAEEWAKKNGKPFHDLSLYPNLGKEAITILDDSEDAPIIIYMPLFKDPKLHYSGPAKSFNLANCIDGDCNTINFNYSEDNFEGLTALGEQNMVLNEDKIVKALQEAGNRAISKPWYL